MNKRKVEKLLPKAIETLDKDIFNIKDSDDQGAFIEKGFRSQISSFGAAVTMGSFRAAVAFFAADGESDVERSKLICIMYYIITNEEKTAQEVAQKILSLSSADEAKMKEDFINASIAIKLALNAFRLKDKKDKSNKKTASDKGEGDK